ncbi:PadR family transcriptional regulator [Comamonas thiooxydans]|uniref:PadR family transcriptional regulator n=1 Tax=Comamonas thiooxydans TaxID=363952 RepID=UPI003F822CB1
MRARYHRISISKFDIAKNPTPNTLEHHDLLSGFIRLHVLHHAGEQAVYGQWMIDELAHHGYRLSPGTLYPMLHKMERDGYLVSRQEREGRTVRKLYTITIKGQEGLALAKERIREFTGEAMHK